MNMTREYRGYVFTVAYEARDRAYVVDFPDIPEIVTSGATLGDACTNACEALDLHLESLQKLGKALPHARHQLVVEQVGR